MVNLIEYFAEFLFPSKCILCRELLDAGQLDLCPTCRKEVPDFTKLKIKHSFIARWTCLWYYKDTVRLCILRYKFYNHTSYARSFARLLAIRLQKEGFEDFDILTWVPVSSLRKFRRGYDQVELLAHALAKELNVKPVRTLKKVRNTPPQSTIREYAHRRANVMGVYRVLSPELVKGKRILLLDDVITSGATASECAKTLSVAGAKHISFAAIAAAEHTK